MSRVWVFLRRSTIESAWHVLKSLVPLEHWRGRPRQAEQLDQAAEDLKRAEQLADTRASREEIEHASHKRDQGGP